jgi:hypothetical protein
MEEDSVDGQVPLAMTTSGEVRRLRRSNAVLKVEAAGMFDVKQGCLNWANTYPFRQDRIGRSSYYERIAASWERPSHDYKCVLCKYRGQEMKTASQRAAVTRRSRRLSEDLAAVRRTRVRGGAKLSSRRADVYEVVKRALSAVRAMVSPAGVVEARERAAG